MEKVQNLSCVMVIFGATGDLTQRKLLPALYNLWHEGLLPESFAVVAVGRREKTSEEFREEAYKSVRKFARFEPQEDKWQGLKSRIYYSKVEFFDEKAYRNLSFYLSEMDELYKTQGNRIYYLATAPEFFEVIADNLKANEMAQNTGAWQRLVIEKPFGRSLATARYLNSKITDVFSERNIYRIDHYLGKEMVQSISGIRFANTLFEPVWNSRYIDNIQISSSETIGVESRGAYYDKAGALGDMVQNHMLQILALVAMEPPAELSPESIRDEKVKLLKSVVAYENERVIENIVFGQYGAASGKDAVVKAYRQENMVAADSSTETFFAMKLMVENERWRGMPFYIRTGKRLASKSTEIVIQFKPGANALFPNASGELEPNLLVIRVQPREEIFLQINTKKPGIQGKISSVRMNFCQNCEDCEAYACSPEAYEKLIFDVMQGDSTLFTRWDEVEQSWKLIDNIASVKNTMKLEVPDYLPGTWGPYGSAELLGREGRHWWIV